MGGSKNRTPLLVRNPRCGGWRAREDPSALPIQHAGSDVTSQPRAAEIPAALAQFQARTANTQDARGPEERPLSDVEAEEPASDVPGPAAGHMVAYDLDGHIGPATRRRGPFEQDGVFGRLRYAGSTTK